MSTRFTRKLVKIGDSYRVTIPKEMLAALEWIEGDILALTIRDGSVLLEKD